MTAENKTQAKGSWGQRIAIDLLGILLGVLVYWLVGFVLDDISNLPGPDLQTYTAVVSQAAESKQAKQLDSQINQLQTQINTITQQQALLKSAMANTQNTINQILEIQRLQAQKGQAAAGNTSNVLQQNTQLFITQQNQLQQMNNNLTQLNSQIIPLQNTRAVLTQKIDNLEQQANKKYDAAYNKYQLKMGLIQIGILLILLAIALYFLFNKALSIYRIIWFSISIAILVKTFFVIHDCFPSRYFKYILTIALIIAVFGLLKTLLKRRAYPVKSYLLKQFRDAYEHFLCPICEYPIRRGPMKYAFWTRRSLKKLIFEQYHNEDNEPYHCPHCGTSLYKQCERCQHAKPSLLPYCEHCGVEQTLENT